MRKHRRRKYRHGFSLLAIRVWIIAMGTIATLALSTVHEAYKLSEGRRVLNDCHQLDEAIDRWAHDTRQPEGSPVDIQGVLKYRSTPGKMTDAFGHPYKITVVGKKQISVNPVTKRSLAGVGIDWGAY